jgi:ABC-type oligopeptide transport system substrate-binding subunit
MTCLVAFDGYSDRQNLPVDMIGLKEYDSVENTITAYEDSYLDLVVNDPSGITNLGYGGNNEIRYYLSNNMHYLAFNMDSEVSDFIHYSNYRYALQYAVDRETAVKTYMQGAAWLPPCRFRRTARFITRNLLRTSITTLRSAFSF